MGQTNDKAGSKRQARKAGKPTARFDSSRFVQYELDAGQKAQCKAWELPADGAWEQLIALADDGYTVTFKSDREGSAYACFVQVRGDDAHTNAGLILSGRGSVPFKAFKQALFKMGAIGPSWHEFAERRDMEIDD